MKKVVLNNFVIFTGKTPALESFFNKVAIRTAILLKRVSSKVFSCEYCKTFKKNYFDEHLRSAATVIFLFSRTPKKGCITIFYLSLLFVLICYIFRFLVFNVSCMRLFQMKIKAIKFII